MNESDIQGFWNRCPCGELQVVSPTQHQGNCESFFDGYVHRNTDGPLSPYAKGYDLQAVKQDFPDFKVIRSYKRFMHAPPLLVKWLALERLLGWHVWVHLQPA